MTQLPVHLTQAAEDDLIESRAWYLQEAPHLVLGFQDEISAAIQRISSGPRLYAKIDGPYRRALVHRFPFAIFYAVREGFVEVIAILHQRRNPKRWKTRR